MKRRALVILLVIVGLVLGFVQEKTKVSLNFIMDASQQSAAWDDLDPEGRKLVLDDFRHFRPSEYYSNHDPIELYLNYSKSELGIIKWALLVFWVVIFWGINFGLLRLAFGKSQLLTYLHVGHGLLILLGGGVYVLAKLTNTLQQGYGVSRELIGAAQSMIPAAILGLGYVVFQRIENDEKNLGSKS